MVVVGMDKVGGGFFGEVDITRVWFYVGSCVVKSCCSEGTRGRIVYDYGTCLFKISRM